MMNFDEFLEAAKDRVQETIPDAEVKIQQVNKLQGESYTGISVQPEGAAAAVTFNVSPAFERYQDDESQKEAILGKIAADAKQVSSAIPAFSISDITDYSTAKDHLVMQVIPVGPNMEMLENIPHKTVEDIAVVYRVMLLTALLPRWSRISCLLSMELLRISCMSMLLQRRLPIILRF